MYLGNGHVALVDEHEIVIRKIVQQAEGSCSRSPSIQVAGIVLDTAAIAQLTYHFQVEFGTFLQSFCLQVPARLLEKVDLPDQVILYLCDGVLQGFG